MPTPDCAVTNQGLPGTLFRKVGTAPGSPGLRRIIPGNPAARDLAGVALADLPMTPSETVGPHPGLYKLFDIFSNLVCELRSPVTESNRRPSPYHACRFRLMPSGWVGLPQVGAMVVSEAVGLCLALPGAVVTWFVTGFPMPFAGRSLGQRLAGHPGHLGNRPAGTDRSSSPGMPGSGCVPPEAALEEDPR